METRHIEVGDIVIVPYRSGFHLVENITADGIATVRRVGTTRCTIRRSGWTFPITVQQLIHAISAIEDLQRGINSRANGRV